MAAINNSEFLLTVFGNAPESAVPWVAGFKEDPYKVDGKRWGGAPVINCTLPWMVDPEHNNFVAISTFRKGADGKYHRRKENFAACHLIMVDDVGTKIQPWQIPLEPSYKLETSPGNYQYGYLLASPGLDGDLIARVIDAMIAQGLAVDGRDPGMKGVTRYGRLPVGWNTKQKYIDRLGVPFVHQLEEWNPERRYRLEEIIEAFELDLDRVHTRGTRVETDDPILKMLEARGLVKGPMNSKPGIWDVVCPWVEEHTDRVDSGAAYFQPHFDGRDKPGFRCHHGHCEGRTIRDVLRFLKPEKRETDAEARVKGETPPEDGWQWPGGAEAEHTKEPIPLIPEQEPPLPYPLDALGEVLGDAAQAIAEYVQVPKAMAGQSVLAAAALALQPFYDVDVPSLGRPRPLSLNALTIAESGDRKSSTDNLALLPIHAYQHTLWEAYEKEKEAYEAALDGYLSTSKKDRLGRGKPIKPRAPFILVDEPTLEGIHRTFREGRPSLGLFNDEGGQFIGGHAMSKDHVLKTISGLSKLWDGHFVSRVRGGKDESYLLFGKRFSCHLMAQPIVANSLLADKLLMGQGLLARFLITQPASLAGTRLYKDGDPSTDKRLGLYWKTMTAWLEKAMSENDQGELIPSKLPLTQEAKALWVKAYDAIEKELAPGGELGDIKPFAAKAAENTLRVAGVIQAFRNPQSKAVEDKAMKGAIQLMLGHYLKETLRLTTRAEPGTEMAQAQKLLEWLRIKAGSLPFKESLIYQKGPPFARSASRANQLLKILLEHHWIVRTGELYQLKNVTPGGKTC